MNGIIARLAGALLAVGSVVVGVQAETLQGPVRLIDGDTLAIGGDVIRLHGIDAPETRQTCWDARERPYRFGVTALDGLRNLTDGRSVICQGSGRDRYDRLIAVCRAGSLDLNAEMVRQGHTIAFQRFSDDYLDEERAAQQAGAGIWAGTFELPERVREQFWADAVAAADKLAPPGCPIKGNISDRGRIYHTPWSQYYDRTRINVNRGERWFCTDAEALDAGWRAPYR